MNVAAGQSVGAIPPAPGRFDTSTQPSRTNASRAYFPEFEGLRAVAALLVVMVHTTFASGFTLRSPLGRFTSRGEVGVTVFFLISGFLLYRPFAVAHLEGRRAPNVKHFLVRRALRIVPLYWVALTVVYLVSGWSTVHGVAGLAETYLFLQVYSNAWALHGITQAWSLDIEVIFYLVLPVLAAGLGRGRRRGTAQLIRELWLLAVVYGGSVVFRWFVLTRPSRVTSTWHGWLPAWMDIFALGMGLAVVSAWNAQRGAPASRARKRLPPVDLTCWLAAAGVYAVFSTQLGLTSDPLRIAPASVDIPAHALYGLFALLLLLPAVFSCTEQGVVRRLLRWRPVAYLGLVSYGIYLWHQFVVLQLLHHAGFRLFDSPIVFFLLATLALTTLLASVTYWLVERPGIAVGHRWLRRSRESQSRRRRRGSGVPEV